MFKEIQNIALTEKDDLAFLKSIVSQTKIPAYLIDAEGVIIYCNEEFSDNIFGATKEELIGKNIEETLQFAEGSSAKTNNFTTKVRVILTAEGIEHRFLNVRLPAPIVNGEKTYLCLLLNFDSDFEEGKFVKEEILLKTFLEYIPDEIFFKDKEKRYLKINSAMASHLGLAHPAEAVGKTARDFFPPETAEAIEKEDDLILRTGKIYIREQKRMAGSKGSVKWVQFTKGPLPDENGNLIGIFGIAKDITYLKEVEEKDKFLIHFQNIIASIATGLVKFGVPNFEKGLKFSLYKFARFLDAEYATILLVNADNRFVEKYNWQARNFKKAKRTVKNYVKKFSDFVGTYQFNEPVLIENGKIFPKEEKVGKNFLRFFKGRETLIVPIKVNSQLYGSVIFCGIKVKPCRLKENFSIVNIFSEAISNVVENYEIEKGREAMESELRKLMRAVEQSANLIAITDTKFKIEYANPKLLELMEFSFGELEGEKISLLWPDEANTIKFEEIVEAILENQEWTGKLKSITKSGKELWTNVTFSTIRSTNGNPTNYLAVIEDITERLQIENQLAISQKLESIGQLAAGIAHEINTPMQYIGDNNIFIKESIEDLFGYIGKLENLLVLNNPELKEKINEFKEEIDYEFISSELPLAIKQSEEGISKVDKIVKAMKNFAHPGLKIKTKSDINKGIADSIIISKNEWKYCADLIFEPDENLPPVFCQLDEINQVILNMIVNAAHAIQEKFGQKPEEKGKIEIKTYAEGDFAVIEITDNGCGIPEENIPKIYDPFFTTKEVGKGSGQGLAIARNIIVNEHNGSIQVESKVGMGTKFVIKIPFDDTEG